MCYGRTIAQPLKSHHLIKCIPLNAGSGSWSPCSLVRTPCSVPRSPPSPWSSGKCVRFAAGRSSVRLSAVFWVFPRPWKLLQVLQPSYQAHGAHPDWPVFILLCSELSCYFIPNSLDIRNQSRVSRLPYPQLEATLSQGTQNSELKSPKQNFNPPNVNMKH